MNEQGKKPFLEGDLLLELARSLDTTSQWNGGAEHAVGQSLREVGGRQRGAED